MPESRRRKKSTYTPPANASGTPQKPARIGSPSWLVPTMLAMFIIGLLWIVVWYIAPTGIPVIESLGPWNLAVGFGFVGVGFALATRWQ